LRLILLAAWNVERNGMLTLTLNESFSPILFQIALGGIGGFLIGYAIRRVLKVALIIGIVIFSLIVLAYANVIDVDYSGLSESASSIVTAINPALDLLTPLFAHIPFIASLIFGLFLGFSRD
jgi:uncharacterized membrane protein (Fun14 family)